MKTANKLIRQAEKWLGLNEADGSFKQIIDLYNRTEPIPRGYKASYTSEWCAIFVTCLGYKTGMTDLIGAECSVPKFMAIFKAKGIWLGSTAIPKPGDIVIYDWDSARDGDHIGIIERVDGNNVTAIEGNISERVARRNYTIGWSRVTGYARPKYDNADAVFRLYNPKTGEHLFTANNLEADHLVRDRHWTDEGIGWYSARHGTPVHRLYSHGEHHYTANISELTQLVALGWSDEGTACYDEGDVPVYRLYNRNASKGAHHFTTSRVEYQALIKAGWMDEGIGWYTLA